MSTHAVEVIRVAEILPHPNADRLGIVPVWGYQCVVKLGDFQVGDLAIYVPPDYVVPSEHQLFAWLEGKTRIKARKLRGVYSQGLLVPAPEGLREGENVMDRLGIKRWEPPVDIEMGDMVPGPSLQVPVYDVEHLERYISLYDPTEPVVVTEKVHGTNARYVHWDGRMHCGSRTRWRAEGCNVYWDACRKCGIMEWCAANPGFTVFAEVYGDVQDLKYGHATGDVSAAVFDVMDAQGRFVTNARLDAFVTMPHLLPMVHTLACGRFDIDELRGLSTGTSMMTHDADRPCIREGIVITPAVERFSALMPSGRCQWKLINPDYLTRE